MLDAQGLTSSLLEARRLRRRHLAQAV